MTNRLQVVGIGPGAEEFMLPAVRKRIEECDVIIGGRRNLEVFDRLGKEQVIIGNNLDEILTYITGHIERRKIVVLVTGDPGLYSITTFLKEHLDKKIEMEVFPGISSFQYLCSRIKLNWEDLYITSVHGREQKDLALIIRNHKKVALFAGGVNRPDQVCRRLIQEGLEDIRVTVGENLSYGNERIVTGSLEEIGSEHFDSLSIMILEHGEVFVQRRGIWEYQTPGLPDEMFIRGEVPMTKAEVRAVSLAKLKLAEDSVVYDIGAGTGSVSIECALLCRKGEVVAIEKNGEAVRLIHQNIEKFGLSNIYVIQGEAPLAIEGMPEADRIFIGGSGGNMEEIFGWIGQMDRKVRVAVNAVTIESAYEAIDNLEKNGYSDVEVTNIAVSRSRKVGGKHLMQAQNPVYIISGEKKD